MTLNEVMKETADAIREKTGKSELIAPIDFASEIKGISAGGGESGGESGGPNVEYLDLRGLETTFQVTLAIVADSVNCVAEERSFAGLNRDAVRSVGGVSSTTPITYLAVGIDFSRKIKMSAGENKFDGTLMDLLTGTGMDKDVFDSIPRITEAEFYDLNA